MINTSISMHVIRSEMFLSDYGSYLLDLMGADRDYLDVWRYMYIYMSNSYSHPRLPNSTCNFFVLPVQKKKIGSLCVTPPLLFISQLQPLEGITFNGIINLFCLLLFIHRSILILVYSLKW